MDEDDVTNPLSLEELALEVSFKEILSNLILCPSHHPEASPEGKQLNWLPCSSLLSMIPYLESDQLLDIVRSRLDQNLVGTMGDKIRKEYVKKFYLIVDEYSCYSDDSDCSDNEGDGERKEECVVDPWPFFDCVLDESFEELETHVAFPDCEPDAKLIPTIAKRSPLLKKLELDFSLMKKMTKPQILRSFIFSLGSLQHLTDLSLSLQKLDAKMRPTLLSLVGNSCPSLSKLQIYGDRVFKKKEICAIFLGDLAFDTILEEPSWREDYDFSRVKVPAKMLTPICSTLKEFRLNDNADVSDSSHWELYGYSTIFILRHLPLLEKLSLPIAVADAIKVLQEQSSSQVKFEKLCEKSIQRRVGSSSQPNLKSPFSGSLCLTTIGCVNALDKEMLQAVGYFCPLLTEAIFIDPCKLKNDEASSEEDMLTEDVRSPKELESLLSKWPKLTKITIQGFKPNYVGSILKVFGAKLKELRFSRRCEFSLHNLLSCPNLECLCIEDDCSLLESGEMYPPPNPASFLPQLKKLDCDICLGRWSHLFQNKSSLVSLTLFCCHIGCKDKELLDHPRKRFKSEVEVNSNQFQQWNRIPQIWPRLEDLRIRRPCAGLTMTMLANILPQFNKLKSIALPCEFMSKEARLSNSIREQLSRRRPPIDFGPCFWYLKKKCPYVDELEEAKEESNR